MSSSAPSLAKPTPFCRPSQLLATLFNTSFYFLLTSCVRAAQSSTVQRHVIYQSRQPTYSHSQCTVSCSCWCTTGQRTSGFFAFCVSRCCFCLWIKLCVCVHPCWPLCEMLAFRLLRFIVHDICTCKHANVLNIYLIQMQFDKQAAAARLARYAYIIFFRFYFTPNLNEPKSRITFLHQHHFAF